MEVIDIEPDDLIRRMKEGKIYGESQAERALSNFFRREKLVALREIALRRTADRVSRMAEEERSLSDNQDYHTGEHILVCHYGGSIQCQSDPGRLPGWQTRSGAGLQGWW